MDYETSRQKLEALAEYYSKHKTSRNEATTRLHLIDTLFFDCLSWSKDDCTVEESQDRQYADYTFRTSRRVLIVEAKKEGDYFELPAGQRGGEHSISALCKDYSNLKKAIHQLSGYCQSRGVPVGCVCNGHQLVALLATRNDGVPPLEGRALVFPSFEFMLSNFQTLWDSVSEAGIVEGRLQSRMLGHRTSPLPLKLSASIPEYPGIKGRNIFQTDLKIVSDLVLEDLAKGRELEEEFLRECYCQSGALSQFALISKDMLAARYAALFDSKIGGPTLVPAQTKRGITPELAKEGLGRRPILLIGDVGVGKTTFIRHLMKVAAKDVFKDAITLYLDLATRATLSSELRNFVLDEVSRQLYEDHGVDIESERFVLGVYNQELERFRSGIYGGLQESDPAEYERNRLELLKKLIAKRDQHLRQSINHLSKARRKQVIVFLDNADQQTDKVQQAVFLIAQELADTWSASVFLALRPETFHRSIQCGTLSGYHPKAFSISPPRIDRVVKKRLDFGLKLVSGKVQITSLPKQTMTQFHSLEAIMKALQESLNRNEELMEAIDNISGGNVRRALDFVREFFGSGHVDTKKIARIYNDTGSYLVPLHEFLRAIIYGDGKYYDPARLPIANLLDISSPDPKEHFLLPIALNTLSSLPKVGVSGFVETTRIYEALQNLGFTPTQIDFAILRSYEKRLIETPHREEAVSNGHVADAIRLSTVGVYHVQRLIGRFVYIDAIIPDTPILSEKWREQIGDPPDIIGRLERAEKFLAYLDEQWNGGGLKGDIFRWPAVSESLRKDFERVKTQRAARQRRQETNHAY